MVPNHSIDFFETQFQRQLSAREFALNPFEQASLPYVTGRVLELGCGLGNLSVVAARNGCDVVAVDASPTAIEHLSRVARDEKLRLTPVQADIQGYELREEFNTVIAIGALMFFPCDVALGLLGKVQRAVRHGGCAVVNVLINGTTFMDMFDGDRHCLLAPEAVEAAFAGWVVEMSHIEEFPAPHGTIKRFITVVARKGST